MENTKCQIYIFNDITTKSRIHISQKYTPINSIIYVNLKDQYSFKFSNFQILSIRER